MQIIYFKLQFYQKEVKYLRVSLVFSFGLLCYCFEREWVVYFKNYDFEEDIGVLVFLYFFDFGFYECIVFFVMYFFNDVKCYYRIQYGRINQLQIEILEIID